MRNDERSNMFNNIGSSTLQILERLGDASIFLCRVLWGSVSFRLFVAEMYMVGVLSLVIILVSGLFIGLVLGLQGFYTLSQFGADGSLGQLLALSVTRELGPVVTALLFAGRAGSALTSEIGLMKATEQLSSMQMMGVDPLRRVIAPRFWAGFCAMPLLMIVFSAVAIWGGYFVGVKWLGVSEGVFWNNMHASVGFYQDVVNGIIKSVVFGGVVTWIAVYQGYSCVPTSDGIAKATTKTVVYGSLAVLGLDFLLTAVMFHVS
jgi:phospholipid/cholesterol/gamma-HCH transport system permease protein